MSTDKLHAEDALVDEITQSVTAYTHHPNFRSAVSHAKNLVKNYLIDRRSTGDKDVDIVKSLRHPAHKDLIEKIACAIHVARLERGY